MLCAQRSQDKLPDQFYAGMKTHCKECWKARVKARRLDPEIGERIRAYDRGRTMEPQRVAIRRETTARWRQENPAAYKAQTAVGNALRDGKLFRPSACKGCGAAKRLHAHHDDYAKPLEVRWLCVRCHKLAHIAEPGLGANKG